MGCVKSYSYRHDSDQTCLASIEFELSGRFFRIKHRDRQGHAFMENLPSQLRKEAQAHISKANPKQIERSEMDRLVAIAVNTEAGSVQGSICHFFNKLPALCLIRVCLLDRLPQNCHKIYRKITIPHSTQRTLSNVRVFHRCSEFFLNGMMEAMEPDTYMPDDVVYRQHEPATFIVVIDHGEMKVIMIMSGSNTLNDEPTVYSDFWSASCVHYRFGFIFRQDHRPSIKLHKTLQRCWRLLILSVRQFVFGSPMIPSQALCTNCMVVEKLSARLACSNRILQSALFTYVLSLGVT